MVKVTAVNEDVLTFEDGTSLYSDHDQDCCESHYLTFKDLSISDFEGLEFDLSSDSFFERVEGYGIRLLPTNGQPVSVPGYGYNNGYYSSNLSLILEGGRASSKFTKFDITECQDLRDY